jgi:hypothetical protein
MLKLSLAGIFAILALVLLLWISFNSPKKENQSKYTLVRIGLLIITIALFSATYIFYFGGAKKGMNKSQILYTLRNLSDNKIKSLMFFYESNDSKFRDTIFIENDSIVKIFSRVLGESEHFNPNHPTVYWSVNLKINLENGKLDDISFKIKQDKRNGSFYFNIMKNTRLGNLYLGAYSNNELGGLLKEYYFEKNKIKE